MTDPKAKGDDVQTAQQDAVQAVKQDEASWTTKFVNIIKSIASHFDLRRPK